MENFERYSRQLGLDDFSEEAQARLKASSVALLGLGGVGGAALPLLVGAGIGKIICADDDAVSESNLHRQTLYRGGDIGRPKAEAAKERMEGLNPHAEICALQTRIETPEDAAEFLRGADLCIDAADSFETRILMARACKAAGVREIMACAQGYTAQISCLGAETDIEKTVSDRGAESEKAKSMPIFGPAAHLSGVLAASIALRTLAGLEPFPEGKFFGFDLARMRLFDAEL